MLVRGGSRPIRSQAIDNPGTLLDAFDPAAFGDGPTRIDDPGGFLVHRDSGKIASRQIFESVPARIPILGGVGVVVAQKIYSHGKVLPKRETRFMHEGGKRVVKRGWFATASRIRRFDRRYTNDGDRRPG